MNTAVDNAENLVRRTAHAAADVVHTAQDQAHTIGHRPLPHTPSQLKNRLSTHDTAQAARDLPHKVFTTVKDGAMSLQGPTKKLSNKAVDASRTLFTVLSDSSQKAMKIILAAIKGLSEKIGQAGQAAKNKVAS